MMYDVILRPFAEMESYAKVLLKQKKMEKKMTELKSSTYQTVVMKCWRHVFMWYNTSSVTEEGWQVDDGQDEGW